MSTTFGFL